MASEGLRQRAANTHAVGQANGRPNSSTKDGSEHPDGEIKHGPYKQVLRIVLLALYFVGSCFSMHLTQILGSWLYFYQRDWFYAWMAVTKQHFSLLIMTMQQWWAPVTVRVSWDRELHGQFRQTEDGKLETEFPERILLIANHQIYIEWLYLWWIAYTSKMHGHIYIILKESLKWIPLLGQGMQFFSFIFMSRKWEADKPRLQHRLQMLNRRHKNPEGKECLNPMWLLIFPEGTNLSANTRKRSVAWAAKQGIPDMQHQLLPRSTGLMYCLQELSGTVDYVYDCTIAYEGVPSGAYAQDVFTLRDMYFQGLRPASVNFHWRRFALSTIPFNDADKFSAWLIERWREKDALIEQFRQTGRFPAYGADGQAVANGAAPEEHAGAEVEKRGKEAGFIEAEVQPRNPVEFLQMYVPWLALALVLNVAFKFWGMLRVLVFW